MIIKSKKSYWWIIACFLIGISLQLESASAVFYIPVYLVIAVWQRGKIPDLRTIFYAGLAFFVTLLPQIFFNFRHDNIIFNNFINEIIKKNSFKLSFWQVFRERVDYIWTVYYSKIFPEEERLVLLFSIPVFYQKVSYPS